MNLQVKALKIRNILLDFYGYPELTNPMSTMDELVSTVLSQNTNDTNRDRAFNALKKRYVNWESLRDADPQDVIETIRPAGLANQKGPRIQAILREITNERGSLDLSFLSLMPVNIAREWLMKFPGIGPKTAAIVLLFTLSKPAFPVDTHIYRVTGRLGLRPIKISPDKAHQHLEKLFPPEAYVDLHLNLIRLGREICQARKPKCQLCPLRFDCDYYQTSVLEKEAN